MSNRPEQIRLATRRAELRLQRQEIEVKFWAAYAERAALRDEWKGVITYYKPDEVRSRMQDLDHEVRYMALDYTSLKEDIEEIGVALEALGPKSWAPTKIYHAQALRAHL